MVIFSLLIDGRKIKKQQLTTLNPPSLPFRIFQFGKFILGHFYLLISSSHQILSFYSYFCSSQEKKFRSLSFFSLSFAQKIHLVFIYPFIIIIQGGCNITPNASPHRKKKRANIMRNSSPLSIESPH